jgi:hypothetical protein
MGASPRPMIPLLAIVIATVVIAVGVLIATVPEIVIISVLKVRRVTKR